MKKVFYYLKPYLIRMFLGLFIKFSGTIMDLFLPYILSYIIDDVIPKGEMIPIYIWGGVMIACAFLAWISNIAANRMASRVARNTTQHLRYDLFKKISYLSCRQTDNFTIPSLISRLTSDSYNVHQMIGSMQRLGVRAPILLIGGVCVTMTLEPVLTLVLLSILPILGVVIFTISKKGIPLYTAIQEAVDRMVRKIQENMTGVRVIKALSKSDYEKEQFDKINNEVIKKEQIAGMTMAVTNPVMSLLLNIGLTLVIVVGALRVNAGLSQAGKIIAFLSYFTIILNALLMVNRMFVMFSKGTASAKRIAEILEEPEELQTIAGGAPKDGEKYAVEFDHVSFSYNNVSDNLTDISFKLRQGQTLGIIGATGSGKSTIINLLMRFYDVNSGEIRINGMNIKNIPNEVLHTSFGVVFQNDFLYADTIRENIDFGRGLTENDIRKAAVYAQAGFITDENEKGLDYELTVKGANLSGGQKQRLLIARALAANPSILILDDSSSALDYKTDAQLRKAIYENYKDTTTIIIAQRISSIKNADCILMLEDGAVIGSGTHEQMLESCEAYKEICDVQMGGDMYE